MVGVKETATYTPIFVILNPSQLTIFAQVLLHGEEVKLAHSLSQLPYKTMNKTAKAAPIAEIHKSQFAEMTRQ